uniref:Probable leucine-rich repeat receptor-like serine/threonine-protein kinase At3g14840 n=1 Tax=Nicotiana sylvestris TaxID=4096 RepID=A0A1U7Y534_NICSY|nr:PREDICTED: probable leucine-rich repeat receptor-like serine/threonine-protein kinase At3g14840 [Nicotiana sylvestris]
MFDVYIQGERKLKDFDIRSLAGEVDKALIRKFNAVVEDGILEVRFQYAGKGTTAVPIRGNYGPLISAISFESSNTTIALWFTSFSFQMLLIIVKSVEFGKTMLNV